MSLSIPRNQNYQFTLKHLNPIYPSREQEMAQRIGALIPDEKTSHWTSFQKARAAVISMMAIATISMAITGALALTVATPIGWGVLGAGIVLLGSGAAWIILGENFEDPAVRAKHQTKIVGLSFFKLSDNSHFSSNSYSIDTLVGYDLLARKILNSGREDGALVYAEVEDLFQARKALDDEYHSLSYRIQHIFDSNTQGARWTRDLIETNARLTDQVSEMQYRRYAERQRRRGKEPSGWSQVGRVVTGVASNWQIADANRDYGIAIAPWLQWRDQEKANLRAGYQEASAELEQRYESVFNAFNIPNVTQKSECRLRQSPGV